MYSEAVYLSCGKKAGDGLKKPRKMTLAARTGGAMPAGAR